MFACCSGTFVIQQSEVDGGKISSRPALHPESLATFGGVDAVYCAVKDDEKYQISRNKIRTWLKQQDVYTLPKPVRYKFRRNRMVVGSIYS